MMTFFSSAVRSRDGPDDTAEEDAGTASDVAAVDGVRSDVMVLDEPAHAVSARLAAIIAIALDEIVGKGRVHFSRAKLSIISGRLQINEGCRAQAGSGEFKRYFSLGSSALTASITVEGVL
jgi:hypothetical protein